MANMISKFNTRTIKRIEEDLGVYPYSTKAQELIKSLIPNSSGTDLQKKINDGELASATLVETGSVTKANMKLSLVDGTAFIDIGADISTDYAGADTGDHDYLIEVYDSAGKKATGYIGAIGGGETLSGDERVTNGTFDANVTGWSVASPPVTLTWNASGWADGDRAGGAYSVHAYQSISSLVVGGLYKTSLNIIAISDKLNLFFAGNYINSVATTGVKNFYSLTKNVAADITFSYSDSSNATVSFDDVSIQQVTDCHTNGVHIISTADGSTQNWASIDAAFNYNDQSGYTYFIYAS